MNYLWAETRGPNADSPTGLHVTTHTSPPFHLTCQCHCPNPSGARGNVLPCLLTGLATLLPVPWVHQVPPSPFGIAWPLAKTGRAQTYMTRLPWHSGAQDTLQIHLCILPRILPDLGSLGLLHLWVMTMGTIVTMPRRSATLHRFPLAIVPVVGCVLACAPRHHPLAPCAVEDHVPCARTLLLLRLPRGPLAQAQGVHPWHGRPSSTMPRSH